jgi:6-phosphogluconolactonase
MLQQSRKRSAVLAAVATLTTGFVWSGSVGETAEPKATAVGAAAPFYIGTYTGPKSRGIYRSQLDPDGHLTAPALVAETVNPSFLALHPTRPLLYAVNEVGSFGGSSTGSVSAYAIETTTGRLKLLSQVPSGGAGPCHLTVDPAGRHVLVANYDGGSVAAISIREDGSLAPTTEVVQHRGSSVDPKRQEGPHAHAVEMDAAGQFALVADLGLDRIFTYRLDAARGALLAGDPGFVTVRPGAGPRHLAFHPSGRFVYAVNEMHLTVTAFRYDAERGLLETLQTVSSLPAGVAPKATDSGAEIAVHPEGRFLYVSNRGPDSIAVFALDPETGTLTQKETVSTLGRTPRSFGIDPSGRFLLAANQGSDSIVVFRIDPASGHLTAGGGKLSVGAPVCISFLRRR